MLIWRYREPLTNKVSYEDHSGDNDVSEEERAKYQQQQAG
jgi:hypothetical protein